MGGAIKDKMVQDMIANKKYYKYGITAFKGGTEDSVAILMGGKQYSPEQISGKTGQSDPLSPVEPDHWKPGSIDPLLFDKNSKELFLSQRA